MNEPGQYQYDPLTGRYIDNTTGKKMPIEWQPTGATGLSPTTGETYTAGDHTRTKTAADISAAPRNPFADMYPTQKPTGLQQGNPLEGAEGLDFLKQGPVEKQWEESKGAFTGPSRAGTNADKISATFGVSGPKTNTGNAQTAFDDFLKTNPADTSAFYDNEARKGQERIDRTMAARGAYGSSAAADMIGEMNTNLAADKAKFDAGYGLQRAGLEGTLGSGADSSNIAGSSNTRAWTSGIQGMLTQGDTEDLSKATAGIQGAATAQEAARRRGQGLFDNTFTAGSKESDIMGHGFDTGTSNDLDLMAQQIALELGIPTEQVRSALSKQTTNTNQTNEGLSALLEAARFYKDAKE